MLVIFYLECVCGSKEKSRDRSSFQAKFMEVEDHGRGEGQVGRRTKSGGGV